MMTLGFSCASSDVVSLHALRVVALAVSSARIVDIRRRMIMIDDAMVAAARKISPWREQCANLRGGRCCTAFAHEVTDALLAIDASGVFDEPVAPYVLFGIKT
jgi:hypothetical protein